MSTKTKWTISLLGALATAIIMQTQGAGFKTDFTPLGIVSLELASSITQVQQILAVWNRQDVLLNIGLDFLFIPAYTFFFIQSLKITISKHTFTWLQKIGTKLLAVAYLAATLDVIENILMLSSSMGHYSASSVCATATVATMKFLCIACVLFYLILSLPVTIKQRLGY
ncbi:MAG: hypothetical protein ACKOWL_05660 [Sphingobacteriaceae bacterium]